ncbi:MAG TPA: peptidoglycan-associated lipoprotein Pal [Elusimicrobiota bacterium]|nr:peptidoglycan-associated lipoprotein Pal [Elusimicrobiota bacterium]
MNLKSFFAREWSGTILAAGVLLFAACTPKQVKMTPSVQAPPVAVSTVPAVNVAEANLRTGAFTAIPEVKTAYFDFNKADLTQATRAILRTNAAYLKEHPELDARVAGYCDERGTVEYNLALGQRRAKAVRDYYILLGVDGGRIATISYGKENPVCLEHAEACWAQNRRAETGVRANESAAPVAPTPAAAPVAAPPATTSAPAPASSSGQ